MRKIVSLAVVAAGALSGNASLAQKIMPQQATPAELAMMPEYCRARLGPVNASYEHWNKTLGPNNFVHIHHFCHGLKYSSRAQAATDSKTRHYYAQVAMGEFDYVLQRWPATFHLTAEAKTRRTHAEFLLRSP